MAKGAEIKNKGDTWQSWEDRLIFSKSFNSDDKNYYD